MLLFLYFLVSIRNFNVIIVIVIVWTVSYGFRRWQCILECKIIRMEEKEPKRNRKGKKLSIRQNCLSFILRERICQNSGKFQQNSVIWRKKQGRGKEKRQIYVFGTTLLSIICIIGPSCWLFISDCRSNIPPTSKTNQPSPVHWNHRPRSFNNYGTPPPVWKPQ